MVGEVTAPFGIDGAVRVFPTTDFPERLLALSEIVVDKLGGSRSILHSHAAPPMAVLQLAGFTTREQAETLRGAVLMVPEATLPPLVPDAYYWHELVGLTVKEVGSDRILGRLTHVLRTGAGHDVFEVERVGRKPLLIPALKSVVKTVDLTAGCVWVDLLPGLEDAQD